MLELLTKLDDVDKKILGILQRNGNLSNVEIAKEVNLSPPATHGRIKRLEKEGIIHSHVTVLNREKLGYDLLCFIYVKTNEHTNEKLEPFEQAICAMPEVLECHHITGEYDYLLKVVIKNSSDLKNFIGNKLSTHGNISGVQTSLAYDVLKSTTVIPIPK
jgi:DNA-binding Lrp family transcriptional regulator